MRLRRSVVSSGWDSTTTSSASRSLGRERAGEQRLPGRRRRRACGPSALGTTLTCTSSGGDREVRLAAACGSRARASPAKYVFASGPPTSSSVRPVGRKHEEARRAAPAGRASARLPAEAAPEPESAVRTCSTTGSSCLGGHLGRRDRRPGSATGSRSKRGQRADDERRRPRAGRARGRPGRNDHRLEAVRARSRPRGRGGHRSGDRVEPAAERVLVDLGGRLDVAPPKSRSREALEAAERQRPVARRPGPAPTTFAQSTRASSSLRRDARRRPPTVKTTGTFATAAATLEQDVRGLRRVSP